MYGAPLIELTGIGRMYQTGEQDVHALDQVSLKIEAGEFVALMGRSGSGKSTLMNIIGCLDTPSSGTYLLGGEDVAHYDPAALRRRMFGFVFQRYNLLTTATANENIELPALYANMKAGERQQRRDALLRSLGLADRGRHYPAQLSGGQQQRVAIARALMNNPSILLADEPTGALDSSSGEEVLSILRTLHKNGRTIILVTHDEKVAAHAERIITLQDGKIIDDKVVREPAHERLAKFSAFDHAGLNVSVSFFRTLAEAAKTARRSLGANLFRTVLTLLGIIIGVAAVIAMMAAGNGGRQQVLAQIGQVGTHILTVRPNGANSSYMGDSSTMSLGDADEIRNLPGVEAVNPERAGKLMVRAGHYNHASYVQGADVSLPQVRDWPVGAGLFFNAHDLNSQAAVAVLGVTAAHALFPGSDPVGQYIIIGNIPFQVVGTMSAKGASSAGVDLDDTVFVPITTALSRLFSPRFLASISVRVTEAERMPEVQQMTRTLLLHRHNSENFVVQNTAALIKMVAATQGTLTTLLGVVAAISLLVGGIGVMNIMLVNVSERTREIGVRMAIGARRKDILLQFNIEAAIVCIIGGALGVGAGLLTGWVISLFGVPIVFSLSPGLTAFCCAFVTGVVFGFLPARKAAMLDPAIALASE